ncbi:hypothetical protein JOM56_008937 [Amanita muscaria]
MANSYPPIWASLKLSDGDYDDLTKITDCENRSESYAEEINRRLALHLERSGGYPLRLDIALWSDHFTMMALETLSACSHRWQTAKFELLCTWALDSILPCKANLPTLEWVDIGLTNKSGAYSSPAFLSWFEAPSLGEIYLGDYQQDYDEPLDVHGQISSLIQRPSCRIRKLSFASGRKFYVGTLEDVKALVIDYQRSDGIRSSIDIAFLPKLPVTTALKSVRVPTKSECSESISLLERVMVELRYDHEEPKIPKRLLKIAEEWPAFTR